MLGLNSWFRRKYRVEQENSNLETCNGILEVIELIPYCCIIVQRENVDKGEMLNGVRLWNQVVLLPQQQEYVTFDT